jgi:hypothetical protein
LHSGPCLHELDRALVVDHHPSVEQNSCSTSVLIVTEETLTNVFCTTFKLLQSGPRVRSVETYSSGPAVQSRP